MPKKKVFYIQCDECAICMDSLVNTGLMPCRHVVVCTRCSKLIVECPVCRSCIARRNFFNSAQLAKLKTPALAPKLGTTNLNSLQRFFTPTRATELLRIQRWVDMPFLMALACNGIALCFEYLQMDMPICMSLMQYYSVIMLCRTTYITPDVEVKRVVCTYIDVRFVVTDHDKSDSANNWLYEKTLLSTSFDICYSMVLFCLAFFQRSFWIAGFCALIGELVQNEMKLLALPPQARFHSRREIRRARWQEFWDALQK
eukprot:TRINITY_DN105192_c0_g1_i1.p1 TRINITY_DN105192_c0_g1~~TRINITY_DN105192_c0_g1_i1.p1  ORF type:complete len:257 (-),score=15.15 TRINITY_DN105192_c0_g1_i1:196-966(-)